MLFQQSPLSLELGVIDGQVVQAFRTENQLAARTIKNGLKNAFTGCRLSNLPDGAFAPQEETSIYFADVQLTNDLYSIRRWKELLTESDPLSGLLASLAVNQHARFFGHVSFSMLPMNSKKLKIHRDCFLTLQSEFFQNHEQIASLFESTARSSSLFIRILATPMRLLGRKANQSEPSITVGSSRHHERETDTQSASNKLNSSCFMTSIRIRVFGPANQTQLASSLIHQIFAPLAQYNSPRLGQFKLGKVRTKPLRRRKKFILSCSEVASIFHPPTTKTERLATTRLVQLEPPRKLPETKQNKQIVEVGKTLFHEDEIQSQKQSNQRRELLRKKWNALPKPEQDSIIKQVYETQNQIVVESFKKYPKVRELYLLQELARRKNLFSES